MFLNVPRVCLLRFWCLQAYQPGCSLCVHSTAFNSIGSRRRLSSGGALVMDAGEGVLGQMTRLWGSRGAAVQAAALAAVLISHKHADHVLGVPVLLAARPHGAPPLIIVGAYLQLLHVLAHG